jgi:hypothetical protein
MKLIHDLTTTKIIRVLLDTVDVDCSTPGMVIVIQTGERFSNASCVQVEDDPNVTAFNYYYDGEKVHTLRLKPLEAYDRLTVSERIAIRALGQTDEMVKDWLHRFDIVAYQNTPFEIGPGSSWHGGMSYLNSLDPQIVTTPRLTELTT